VFEEDRQLPDALLAQRLAERRHSGKADPVIDFPKGDALGVVFDAILGKLRGTLIEAACDN